VAERLKVFQEIRFLMVTSGSADIYADAYALLGSNGNDLISLPLAGLTRLESCSGQPSLC
jgi:hypothetical protein